MNIFKRALFTLVSLIGLAGLSRSQNYNFNVGGLSYSSGASLPSSCSSNGSFFYLNTGSVGWYQCNANVYVKFTTGTALTGITAGTGIAVSGSSPSPTVNLLDPLNGVLTVDGVDHTSQGGANATTLCPALNYVSTHPGTVHTVIDNVVEAGSTAFSKDPFNDSTCGNKANGYTLRMEVAANWMTSWPSIQIPSSVRVILGRRASENQLGTGNTLGGTLVAACMPNVAPWNGTFAMGCSANYPGAKISTISRTSNTLTIVTTAAHNYTSTMASSGTVLLFLWNVTGDLTMNGLCTLNGVTNSTTITCNDATNPGSAATGTNGSGVVDSTSSVGSPLIVLGNSGIANNDFDARLEGGTFSCAGAIGCVGFANYDDQERGILEQTTFTGWQAACGAVITPNSQNWDFQHIECLTGFRTGLASASGPGTPVSAIGIYWSVNGPSRGFQNLTVNPRGTATLGPIRCDIVIAGTQGGAFIGEHMENAQYQYCTLGSFSGVATRDAVLITANTGSTLQGQTPTAISRNGSNVVTATYANPTGCVTGEKITVANVTGGATSFNGTFSSITCGAGGYLATSITWAQTGAAESGTIVGSACGGSNSCATLGGKSTHKFCASSSTDAICSLGTNTNSSLRTTAIGAVRISPSIVLNAVEDDAATNGNGVILSGAWNGTYMQSAPDFGSVQSAINGGTNSAFFNVLGLTVSRNITFPDAADTVMELGQPNVLAAGGGLDAHSVTGVSAFRIPAIAGATATVSGALNYDTTNKNLHFAINSADTIVPTTSITPVNGNVPTWVVASGNDKLGDSGVPPALKAFLTTTYTNATTTFSTVTGLSFSVSASTNYKIRCDLDYQTSATTADVKIQFTGPASPTAVTYDLVTEVTGSTLSAAVATAFSTALSEAGTPTITTNFPLTVTLTLINGVNAGTVTLQAAATGTGTISILPGSCVMQ